MGTRKNMFAQLALCLKKNYWLKSIGLRKKRVAGVSKLAWKTSQNTQPAYGRIKIDGWCIDCGFWVTTNTTLFKSTSPKPTTNANKACNTSLKVEEKERTFLHMDWRWEELKRSLFICADFFKIHNKTRNTENYYKK